MIRYPMPVNGTYYVVEAVPETRFKKFWVVSAYADGRRYKSIVYGENRSRSTGDAGFLCPNYRE